MKFNDFGFRAAYLLWRATQRRAEYDLAYLLLLYKYVIGVAYLLPFYDALLEPEYWLPNVGQSTTLLKAIQYATQSTFFFSIHKDVRGTAYYIPFDNVVPGAAYSLSRAK